MNLQNKAAKPVSRGRHRRSCTVCEHERCTEIEADFVGWKSPALIAQEYGLADRTSVYRHAHAFGLFEKRKRNVRAALERIIEKASEVEVTSSAVVAAVQAYAKINAPGQWIERSEHIDLNALFERMSEDELEDYARDGNLPTWFNKPLVFWSQQRSAVRRTQMARFLGKSENRRPLTATHPGPRPGDFPLGSPLSRAAARILLNSQPDSRKRIEVITNVLL